MKFQPGRENMKFWVQTLVAHVKPHTSKCFHRLYKSISALLRRKRTIGIVLEVIIGYCTCCALIDRKRMSIAVCCLQFDQIMLCHADTHLTISKI